MQQSEQIEKIIQLSDRILQLQDDQIDYQRISDDFLGLIGAQYAAFNIFDTSGESFTTVALSGEKSVIAKATKLLGFSLKNKVWPHDPVRLEKIKGKTVTRFATLSAFTADALPKKTLQLIEKVFNLGEVIVVRIIRHGRSIGDFTIIMGKDHAFESEDIAELYARQLGILMARKQDEKDLTGKDKTLTLATEKLSSIIESTNAGTWEWNFKTGTVEVNDKWAKLIGYTVAELSPISFSTWESLCHAEDLTNAKENINQMLDKQIVNSNTMFRMRHKNGNWVWINSLGKISEWDIDGKPLWIRGIHLDITKQKQLEAEIKLSAAKYRNIFNQSPIAIELYDSFGGLVQVNDSCLKMFGVENMDEISGFNLFDDPNISDEMKEALRDHNHVRYDSEFNFDEVKRLGLYRTTCEGTKQLDVSIKAIDGEEGVAGYIAQINDISVQKQAQQEIEFQNFHDYLTGLYNRRFYEEELKRLNTERNLPITIIVGDADGLKKINDNYGHLIGDEMLKSIGKALKKACREDDIIARIGGDEFVIILPKTTEEEANIIIERINGLLSKQKIFDQNISISFGCKSKNHIKENILQTFNIAEEYMYQRKRDVVANNS